VKREGQPDEAQDRILRPVAQTCCLLWGLNIVPPEDATSKAIPKGLYRSAQGCAWRYPGCARARTIYPEGVLSPALAYDYGVIGRREGDKRHGSGR
jgi:hypothetical protein